MSMEQTKKYNFFLQCIYVRVIFCRAGNVAFTAFRPDIPDEREKQKITAVLIWTRLQSLI